MSQPVVGLRALFRDRIQWMAVILVASFVAVLSLTSQSRASYPTYALALLMVATFPQWRDVLKLSLLRWVFALLTWLSLSALWSEHFVLRDAVSVWSRSLLIFCFVVAFAECLQRGQMQRWMGWALTLVGAVAVLAAIVNFYATDPADGRLNGLGQLDTHVVAALVYGVVLLFVIRTVHSSESTPLRVLGVAVAAMVVAAVFLSDSRNAWVSVTFGVLVYVLAFRCTDAKQFVVLVLTVALLGSVVLLVAATNEGLRGVLLPRGDSFRLTIWASILDRISADSVFFGRGILTDDDTVAGDILFSHPHNMYLAVLYQGGIVALGLFTVVLAKAFQVLIKFYEDSDAKFALAILSIALSSYLLDGHELVDKIGDTWFLFWLPIGIVLGLSWKNALAAR